MKISKISWIVARKVAVPVQLNLKNAGKILEMGLLKYAFDNKISVTNECNAAQTGEFLSYSECCYPSKNTNYKLPDFFLHI